jgi:putative ABC transport system ATP-binding protein
MDKRPVIEARNLTRVFDGGAAKVQAVQGVSLSVRRGEFVALVGPSGCGKSTLLSMLGLIEQPTSGEVILEGHSVSGASEAELQNRRRTTIGYVFQAFNLLSTLSVEENVMLPCLLTGATEGAARERAAELLAALGMSNRQHAMPGTLSGGEMQRVAIARAVAHRPALILADEPTGNLDSAAGEGVLGLLTEVYQLGTPIVMATHSEAAIARCTRVLRMRDGVIIDGE